MKTNARPQVREQDKSPEVGSSGGRALLLPRKRDKPSVEQHVEAPRKRRSAAPEPRVIDLFGALRRLLREQTGGSAELDEAAKIIGEEFSRRRLEQSAEVDHRPERETRGSVGWPEHARALLDEGQRLLREQDLLIGRLATVVDQDVALAQTSADVDAMLDRLDHGIAAERVAMNRLIERMVSRTPR